jgi:hypothetical protein
LLTGGAGSLKEIESRLAAHHEQCRAAIKEIHGGACHQLVSSYFNMLVLLMTGIYVVYTFTLHMLNTQLQKYLSCARCRNVEE